MNLFPFVRNAIGLIVLTVRSNKNESNCFPIINTEDNDHCTVFIHDIDQDIEKLELEDIINYYFVNNKGYTKRVDHFVNENYTVTLFIYSECTEDLLNRGYSLGHSKFS